MATNPNNKIWGAGQGNHYPNTPFLNENTKMPQPAWTQYFLNLLNFTSSPTATQGSGTLPHHPVGFINITVEGKSYKVPYYNL
jgi:hypothetical protein